MGNGFAGFDKLFYYNAKVRLDVIDKQLIQCEILVGGEIKIAYRKSSPDTDADKQYVLKSKGGDKVFSSFDDLLQQGLGLVKIQDGPELYKHLGYDVHFGDIISSQ